jgi:hypothetical protein
MRSYPLIRFKLIPALIVLIGVLSSAPRAHAEVSSPGDPSTWWDLTDFLDQLPDLRRFDMPQFHDERVRISVRPHFGDIVRRDYLRLPVSVRVQPDKQLELISELEGYFTHGLRDATGYGLSRLRLGAKREQTLDENHPLAWSYGVDFYTPLSRPPRELSDGFRHTTPYAAITRQVVPRWKLIGFASVGADLIDHTQLTPNFGRNQLRGRRRHTPMGAIPDRVDHDVVDDRAHRGREPQRLCDPSRHPVSSEYSRRSSYPTAAHFGHTCDLGAGRL